MSVLVDPNLHREIDSFGGHDVGLCMNCGNCTAICPLSEESGASFPRRIIHLLQVGRVDKLLQTADPWLCYYCGECSESCPRDANPGETMMATRRYLTARYDWTGLAGLFYKSAAAEITALVLVGLFVVALFSVFHGPAVTDHVELNSFAPVRWVEFGDLVMAAILTFFLLTNALRMAWNFMGGAQLLKISPLVYLQQVPAFLVHFFTQKRWRRCGSKRSKRRWLKHVVLVSGYLSMLTLVLVLLRWFQTDEIHPFYHPQRLWGYYATGALLYATLDFMISRWRKEEPIHRFSEASDWIFLIMLFLTALTGIIMHALRIAGLPLATYVSYVIHLAIAVPMLVVEVPFGKWAHLLYRPLAIYLTSVKQAAAARAKQSAAVAVQA
ncbi:MAG: 4Fe-4S dicluster domain-containing protein [Bryobacteraceae bacterium]